MLVVGFPAGPWATNCWILATGPGSECVIVDPGMAAAPGIADAVREHGLQPVAVMLSHGHIDHMYSVMPVCRDYSTPAWIHPADRALLTDPFAGISAESRQMLASMTGGTASFAEPDDVQLLADGAHIEVAGLTFTAAHAPGHTPGSTAFTLPSAGEAPPLMVSGDLLFAGSIGRTDLPGGDSNAMMESLSRVVLPQPDEMVVLTGHGETTTIAAERATNPYLRQIVRSPRRGL